MTQEFVSLLQAELAKRCEKNPRYSLRAFAQTLGVSPATLSLLLSGKREPSRKVYKKITQELAWNLEGYTFTEDNVTLDTFEKISSWVSYAILSLMVTKDFEGEPAWIAKRLGVTVHQVRDSIAALKTAGVLEVNGRGKWIQAKPKIRINNKISTSVSRRFQKDLIEKSLDSLENDPMDIRDHSSITFALSVEDIPKAKAEIRKMRLKIAEMFERSGKSSEVYNMTVQLTPVTKASRK